MAIYPKTVVQHEVAKAIDEYKAKVAKVALKYAVENDWCDVNEALAELGIEVPPVTTSYAITFDIVAPYGAFDPEELRREMQTYVKRWIIEQVEGNCYEVAKVKVNIV